MKAKLLFLTMITLLAQNLSAKDTTCYIKNWTIPSSVETIELNGGECKGKYSLRDMKQRGWFIKDININANKKGLDYTYILTNVDPVVIKKESKEVKASKKSILLQSSKNVKITNVNDGTATINIANLKLGQSGIISHFYKDNKSIIVADAYVVSSNNSSSTIKFLPFLALKQNAIPTSNRKAQNNDIFTLNYLYNTSLLITPDATSFRATRLKFLKQNFQHSDIFASYLKIEQQPLPSKSFIQDYAIQEDLGTIFIVIKSKVYIVDTRTFAILETKSISYLSQKEQMPFYTRVQKIEAGFFSSSWTSWFNFKWFNELIGDDSEKTDDEIIFGEEAKEKLLKISYTEYYSKLLGL